MAAMSGRNEIERENAKPKVMPATTFPNDLGNYRRNKPKKVYRTGAPVAMPMMAIIAAAFASSHRRFR